MPFTLFAYAERHVTSALASIGNATVPLFTLLFALLFLPSERPTVRRTAGLAVGFVGVLVVLGAWHGLTAGPDTAGMLLILVAAACYGLSGVYMRRYLSSTSYSSLALSVGQIGVGAVQLALVLPFATHLPGTFRCGSSPASSPSAPSAPASPTCSCMRSSASPAPPSPRR